MTTSKESPQSTHGDRFADYAPQRQRLAVAPRFAQSAGKLAISKPGVPVAQFSKREAAPLSASQSPYLVHWLQSGSNLDFCVLALCSCVLTVLCHQTALLSPSPTAAASRAVTSSAMPLAQVDFAIKAGLFTTSPKIEEESESE
ncbi:hypothetical protein IFO70_00815 [Phormidium tenue FACHB-886]|nr:hypothetical protein [Phormidium tenue FACHB-886]